MAHSKRGFAAMSKAKQKEIARKGGLASRKGSSTTSSEQQNLQNLDNM
jgi:general stress protein YciG